MKIFGWNKDSQKKVIEALKEQDLKRRDAEIEAMKKINQKFQRGDIRIIIANVDGILRK